MFKIPVALLAALALMVGLAGTANATDTSELGREAKKAFVKPSGDLVASGVAGTALYSDVSLGNFTLPRSGSVTRSATYWVAPDNDWLLSYEVYDGNDNLVSTGEVSSLYGDAPSGSIPLTFSASAVTGTWTVLWGYAEYLPESDDYYTEGDYNFFAVNRQAAPVPTAKKPGAPRSLKVSSQVDAKKRKVSWAAPSSNGGAGIQGYQIMVRKGSKTLYTKNVAASRRSFKVPRRLLHNGKDRVYVKARNRVGFGSNAARSFKVKKPVKAYSRCSALAKDYPRGVARSASAARKHSDGAEVFARVYRLNAKRDRDKDGVACER
ncbi:excalibur calcium-binding domain-containing protein [Mumia sp. zg.B17]|uniref:excalibur calcium-binding domain-containing protein n=1 Tax=Mumia sp. zg.B17 TaxID=2855446 RepID=UPI001C6EDAEC|nr:excalibur calcium-binding domain-containing protein [Mumia sp. zg.B17]MBW9205738.1 excalibur calcium-binding domain-containing protein [Mumia sp. zg.B17]